MQTTRDELELKSKDKYAEFKMTLFRKSEECRDNVFEATREYASLDKLRLEIKRFDLEMLERMWDLAQDLVLNYSRYKAFTEIEKYFLEALYLHCDNDIEIKQHFNRMRERSKTRESTPEESHAQETMRLMTQYLFMFSSQNSSAPENKADSSEPVRLQLANHLADHIRFQGFVSATPQDLARDEERLRSKKSSMKFSSHEFKKEKKSEKHEDAISIHCLLVTAIFNHIPFWERKVSWVGSYSKIDGEQVPGSIARIYALLQTVNTGSEDQLLKALVNIRLEANKCLALQGNNWRYMFGIRDEDVTMFLRILAGLDFNKLTNSMVHELKDNLLGVVGLKNVSTCLFPKEFKDQEVNQLQNGCVIKI